MVVGTSPLPFFRSAWFHEWQRDTKTISLSFSLSLSLSVPYILSRSLAVIQSMRASFVRNGVPLFTFTLIYVFTCFKVLSFMEGKGNVGEALTKMYLVPA